METDFFMGYGLCVKVVIFTDAAALVVEDAVVIFYGKLVGK